MRVTNAGSTSATFSFLTFYIKKLGFVNSFEENQMDSIDQWRAITHDMENNAFELNSIQVYRSLSVSNKNLSEARLLSDEVANCLTIHVAMTRKLLLSSGINQQTVINRLENRIQIKSET